VGAFFPRDRRGVITRPGVAEVLRYRAWIDERIEEFLRTGPAESALDVLELGCEHEAQHQELILMDIKHVLAGNPLGPAYLDKRGGLAPTGECRGQREWRGHEGGLVEIGHGGEGFHFDNEGPRHAVYLQPFELTADLVTNGEWLSFMAEDGYRRPELWLSEGWSVVRSQDWHAPLYWRSGEAGWEQFGLSGWRQVDPAAPVCHVSFFEADAFARWSGSRLPTEAEWETLASASEVAGNFLDFDHLEPLPTEPGHRSMFGDVWQWTASAYSAYPGYRPGSGALGEYNGKFMANQYVLRGGSAVSPAGHLRATYRNFFPATARWVFAGLRLARDC